MKFRSLLFVILFLAAFGIFTPTAQAQSTGNDGGVQLNWTAPLDSVTNTQPPTLCSGTVTKSCLNNYTATFTSPVTGAGAIAITVASNAVTYTYRPGGKLFCGTWNFTLTANWVDNNGGAEASATVPGTINEPCAVTTKANPPTGVTAITVP